MEVTGIRIKKVNSGSAVLGYANVQLDNCLVIHDIKLVNKNGKRILCFPNKKSKRVIMENGKYSEVNTYMDIVHPSNSEFRAYLEDEIFKIYDSELKGVNHNE